jgi:chorismate lyase / 3-hydroxybenzoate synthase
MSQPPLQVQLVPSNDAAAPKGELLARVDYGPRTGTDPENPTRLFVGLPPLSAERASEVFLTPAPVTRDERDGIGFARTDDLLFARLFIADSADMKQAAQEAYERLMRFHTAMGYPALLRIWNFFDRLLGPAKEPTLDRYQAFCAGRQQALEALEIDGSALPAATAIGTTAPGFLVYLLATREPGVQIENPRQVSAYHYPPDYGPKSPTFSRATLKHWPSGPQLYISGTASIVGHASLHGGDVEAQADEVINNLEALIHSGREAHGLDRLNGPADLSLLKVYVRHARDLERVRERIRMRIGVHPNTLFLRGDICRDELLVEIEGLYA